MAQLATCPSCTTQLALPEEATLTDRARCPRCQEEFLLMETVQFSIPTAEILPPLEPGSQKVDEAPQEYEFVDEPFAGKTASEVETAADVSNRLETSKNSTLSDWEARLRRAIAGDVDKPEAEEESEPVFAKPAAYHPPRSAELDDFSVSDSDLIPAASYSAPVEKEPWSAADAYEPEEDLTDRFSMDQTIVDDSPAEESIAVDVNIEAALPKKKRKRSFVRTLASASLGVVGIPLGLYALFWLRGPAGDVLDVAQYVPRFMLPPSFSEIESIESNTLMAEQNESVDAVEVTELAVADEPEEELARFDAVHDDPEVAPASAEEPIYEGPKFAWVDDAEFAELFSAAKEMAPQFAAGDLATQESVRQKGQAYMALARLADKCSYLNEPGHTPQEITTTLLVKQLWEQALGDPVVKRDLPQVALRWWQFEKRPSNGIVFMGTVERTQVTGVGTLAYVALDTEEAVSPVPVLLGNANPKIGESIGLVGTVVANPAEQIPALAALTGPIVIAHYSFPTEDTN